MAAIKEAHQAAKVPAQKFLDFVTKAMTPFHAVQVIKDKLVAEGYKNLSEKSKWDLNAVKEGKFYVTRNDSSIIAFQIGGKAKTNDNVGIKIIGAHTDSPNLALKPKTFAQKGGYMDVGVQTYGGGLWHTWFDRDLTVAGRVVIQKEGETHLTSKLVNIDRPIMRIPTLAIHLTAAEERGKFGPNKENHVVPVICTKELAKAMNLHERDADHNPVLLNLLAEAAGCKKEEVVDFDLSVIDTQAPVIGGAFEEFIHSPRIDNLLSCYCGLEALLAAQNAADDDMVRMIAFFDDEEVGSSSAQGAAGSFIVDVVDRLAEHLGSSRARIVANSFNMSVDGAHGAHPHYLDKHEAEHRPNLHEGPVIKYNANVRYATNGPTAAIVKALGTISEVPIQQICVKNDSPCGSTIGPILATLSGIPSVDIGNAMLSMHSIREMCGTVDVYYLEKLLTTFFERYQDVTPKDE